LLHIHVSRVWQISIRKHTLLISGSLSFCFPLDSVVAVLLIGGGAGFVDERESLEVFVRLDDEALAGGALLWSLFFCSLVDIGELVYCVLFELDANVSERLPLDFEAVGDFGEVVDVSRSSSTSLSGLCGGTHRSSSPQTTIYQATFASFCR